MLILQHVSPGRGIQKEGRNIVKMNLHAQPQLYSLEIQASHVFPGKFTTLIFSILNLTPNPARVPVPLLLGLLTLPEVKCILRMTTSNTSVI